MPLSRLYLLLFFGAAIVAGIFIYREWVMTVTLQAQLDQQTPAVVLPHPLLHAKPPKIIAKGLYLTAYSAANPRKVAEIIDLINKTELNAVVIDIKDYSGYVLYDSQVPLVVQLKTKDKRVKDVQALIRQFHDAGIYVIARQTVFQDPVLAHAKPEWAIKDTSGGVWRDKKGLAWVDASNEDVWEYNIAIAKEAIRLGFDEINFDYVRFPSDGDLKSAVYASGDTPKHDVMNTFYTHLGSELAEFPAYISLDMFGFVMERPDDLQIGQRLVDAVDHVDYIDPMMYPSHYPAGHLGLKNPAAFPELVFHHGLEKGIPQFAGKRAEVRPWIQAFNLGAVYDAEKIRAQIDQIEATSTAGFLMWNAANRYTDAGLRSE